MRRRDFVSFAAGLAAGPRASARVSRPNILFLVADDHGFNDLGCYGHRVVQTPNLDRIAAEGVRFTNAFSTAPLCSPGRGALMTGQYPHVNGVTRLVQGREAENYSLARGKWTLARGLSDLGYDTAAARKWHLSVDGPTAHGFRHAFPDPKDYLARSIDFLDQPRREPWFLYFCPTHTHRPYRRHERFPYAPEEVASALPPYLKDTPLVRDHYAWYLSETSQMDWEFGRLFEAIARRGQWERTVVVYCTDHGPSMHRAKFSLYDWGVRSSLLVRLPGQDGRNAVVDHLASTLDLPATLMTLAGGAAPRACQGVDLTPLLRRAAEGKRRYVHFEHHERNLLYGVRDERFKLIRNVTTDAPLLWPRVIGNWQNMGEDVLKVPYPLPRPPEEFYDLENDPYETENAVADPRYGADLDRLRAEMKRWLADPSGDPG